MKIVIAGDLVPTSSNIERFMDGSIDKVIDEEIIKKLNDADYRIINLETVLGDSSKLKKIYKYGPSLIVPSDCINGIKNLNPDLLLLANNHILDYDVNGLSNTISLLKDNDISFTGIIDNNHTSMPETIIEKDDLKVGIYNLCENEFSVAGFDSMGANGLNEIKNYAEIENLKTKSDYVIVIFHGGKEFYRYPSPKMQQLCYNFINHGADYVIVQHSHCIGCEEEYNNKKIIYGQGNFIFDYKNDEFWDSEMLLTLDISKDGIKTDYTFIEKENNKYFISKEEKIKNEYLLRTKEIKKNDVINKKYDEFSSSYLNTYLLIMNKVTFFNRLKNKLFNKKYYLKKYSKKDYLAILNIIECEAHRELLIQGLKNRIYKDK